MNQSEVDTLLDNTIELHEDMDADALLLPPGDPMRQLLPSVCPAGSGRKKNMKVLNFVKEPELAMPILQIVKAEGFKKSLGHKNKTNFLAKMRKQMVRAWSASSWV